MFLFSEFIKYKKNNSTNNSVKPIRKIMSTTMKIFTTQKLNQKHLPSLTLTAIPLVIPHVCMYAVIMEHSHYKWRHVRKVTSLFHFSYGRLIFLRWGSSGWLFDQYISTNGWEFIVYGSMVPEVW